MSPSEESPSLADSVSKLLEMSEVFKASGDKAMATECKNTANRLMDFLLFRSHGIPREHYFQ